MKCVRLSLSLAVVLAAVCPADAADKPADKIEFSRDIRPILADKCFACHGPAAKGGLLKNGQSAPDIRGASYQKVQDALRGGVPTMSFIKLTPAELEAVVAYLEYLNTLP